MKTLPYTKTSRRHSVIKKMFNKVLFRKPHTMNEMRENDFDDNFIHVRAKRKHMPSDFAHKMVRPQRSWKAFRKNQWKPSPT